MHLIVCGKRVDNISSVLKGFNNNGLQIRFAGSLLQGDNNIIIIVDLIIVEILIIVDLIVMIVDPNYNTT